MKNKDSLLDSFLFLGVPQNGILEIIPSSLQIKKKLRLEAFFRFLYEKSEISMSQKIKRYLGIGVLFSVVGLMKIYSKGIYKSSGEINWFTLLFPFGLGLVWLLFALILWNSERNKK